MWRFPGVASRICDGSSRRIRSSFRLRINVSDLVARYGHVVIDECHHIPAVSFERVLSEAKARYVTGLTATPYRRDGHQPIIEMHCGSTRFSITSKSQTARRPFDHRLF